MRASGAGGAGAWLAGLILAWLLAAGFAEGGARYGAAGAAFVIALYALLAAALHLGALALARRGRVAGIAAALAVGGILAWHLREQTGRLHAHAALALAGVALGLAYWALLRRPAAGRAAVHAGRLACAAGALLAVALLAGFEGRPSFRWYLLRHHRLFGIPAYYLLGRDVGSICDELLAVHAERLGGEPPVPASRPPPPLPAARGERPDLALVLVDTLRADALAAWGGGPELMPRTNDAVRRAVVLGDVWANATFTRPSVASIFTGLRPESHGAIRGSSALAEERVTAAEVLHAAGYETAAFVANYAAVGRDAGFAQGFDHFEEIAGDPLAYARADRVTDTVEAWLAERATRGARAPLFLYVHYLDPHLPYLVEPGPYPLDRPNWPAYSRALRFLDQGLDRLLGVFAQRLSPSRRIVLTADHGEELRDHGGLGHGHTLYRELAQVPVAVLGPGLAPERVDVPLENRDLFHLLLALAGDSALDVGAWARAHERSERFLSVYSRTQAAPHRPDLRRVCMRGVEVGDWFLVWSGFGESLELYDLASDPRERRNLVAQEPERTHALLRLLAEQPDAHGVLVPAHLRPETADLLRRLGYVE